MHEQRARVQFQERIERYMMKAMREAKAHSSWLHPDEEYEGAVFRFIDAILDRRRANRFFQLFEPFQARIAQLGIYNSLAQLAIKITAPGVPDFYQGGELWDLNLVDPDNRRPVDFARRRRLFDGLDSLTPSELLATRADGRVKMHVMHQGLCARAQFRRLFEEGDYVPLDATGARRDCLFAFARRTPASRPDRTIAITCVPRLIATLMANGTTPPLGSAVWKDTRLDLWGAADHDVAVDAFRDVFSGAIIVPEQTATGRSIPAATLFERFPVALLVPRQPLRHVLSDRHRRRLPDVDDRGHAVHACRALPPREADQSRGRPLHQRPRSQLSGPAAARQCDRDLHQRRGVLPRDARRNCRRGRKHQHGVLHLQARRHRRSLHRRAQRARPRRRPGDDRSGLHRQPQRLVRGGHRAQGSGLSRRAVSSDALVPPGPVEQPDAPGAPRRGRPRRIRPAEPGWRTGGGNRPEPAGGDRSAAMPPGAT
jgi:hypothetical protein